MKCKHRNRVSDSNFCYKECCYCTLYQEQECREKHPEYFEEKFKHPFNITCKKCGGDDIVVIAYEHHDLGIKCRCCGYELDCGRYYTKENDYSDM